MSVNAIAQLEFKLAQVLDVFDIPKMEFGDSKAVIDVTNHIKNTFIDVKPATPPKNRAYQAAKKFVQESNLTSSDYDFITGAIHIEIKEENNQSVISLPDFTKLLTHYRKQIKQDEMWSLSWYWLLTSYFNIKPNKGIEANRAELQLFLNQTHSSFTSKARFALPWMKALRNNTEVLSTTPCKDYAKQVLEGDRSQVEILKTDLSIPSYSWFWHELTLSIIKQAVSEKNEIKFKKHISELIQYIERHTAYRDEAIELILKRYYKCSDKSHHRILCDYIIQPAIWGSPKLRDVGLATKWHNVNDSVWQMVRSWVTKENLRIFFQILAGRNNADKGRFEFWLQYVDQIGFIKLVFGEKTKQLRSRNKEIDKLFKEEEGIYAMLTSGDVDLDAFIMQIGKYTFVEFSKKGNAAFIYKNSNLPFSMKARHLNDMTRGDGLKSAQNNKIVHNPPKGWQFNVKNRLMAECNIYPD